MPLYIVTNFLRPYLSKLYVLINSFFLERLDELIPDYIDSAEGIIIIIIQ